MKVLIPSSAGDLVDRITILEVKKLYILEEEKKLASIELHLKELKKVHKKLPRSRTLNALQKALFEVNRKQWKLEDKARTSWKKKDYIATARAARAVHVSNNKRTDLKRKIDEHVGSQFVDEKQYVK